MSRTARIEILWLLVLTTLVALPVRGSGEDAAVEGPAVLDLAAFMPRVEDYTHMWWAEGFPAHTPAAPWRRVVQTGSYAFTLDTDTLRIPHFGPVSHGVCYQAAARADNRAWQSLPPAELVLSIQVGGKTYRGTAGGEWTQFTGPRLIESGRLLQRADVTDLVFTADDGTRLNVEARFETVAWPDRLALVLAARPRLLPDVRPSQQWKEAKMKVRLATSAGALDACWELADGQTWSHPEWQEVSLALDPAAFRREEPTSPVSVTAAELPDGESRPVDYDTARAGIVWIWMESSPGCRRASSSSATTTPSSA
jgi:hypothetical protein